MRKLSNLLITGGCGFIGSNFIKILLDENQNELNIERIINLDKLTYAGDVRNTSVYNQDSRYKLIQGDICDAALVKDILNEFNIDTIVNFAAESHVDNSILSPNEFIDTNILGTYNLLECSRNYLNENNELKFLHVSTDEVYGSLGSADAPFNEDNKYKPNSPYSASKAASDHLVRAWNKTYNLSTYITNCSNNYGPNQNKEKLIPKIISNAFNLKKLPVYGEGLNVRDWLFVDDHCKAIIAVLQKGIYGETYNIGGLNEIKNIEIVKTICGLIEESYPIKRNPNLLGSKINSYADLIEYVDDRQGHDFRYAIDSKKIEDALEWYPEETFDSGIKKTVNWYLDQLQGNF